MELDRDQPGYFAIEVVGRMTLLQSTYRVREPGRRCKSIYGSYTVRWRYTLHLAETDVQWFWLLVSPTLSLASLALGNMEASSQHERYPVAVMI